MRQGDRSCIACLLTRDTSQVFSRDVRAEQEELEKLEQKLEQMTLKEFLVELRDPELQKDSSLGRALLSSVMPGHRLDYLLDSTIEAVRVNTHTYRAMHN
jgi:hypothetical protein